MGLAHLAYLGIGHVGNASAREERISSQLASYAAFCVKSLHLIPLDIWKGMRLVFIQITLLSSHLSTELN